MRAGLVLCAGSALLSAAPAAAGNALVAPGPHRRIASSRLSAVPAEAWNRLGRWSRGTTEVWTLDGERLNAVAFYGGIAPGAPLVRETDRRHHPLPRLSATILPTDVPVFLETTYRALGGVDQMTIDAEAPATLGGRRAIRFAYRFTRADDRVARRGEGVGAMVDGRLYLVTYEAPSLYFFDRDLARFRALVASIGL